FEAALGGRACIVDASVSGDGLLDARHENEMSRGRRLKKSKRTLARLGVREPLALHDQFDDAVDVCLVGVSNAKTDGQPPALTAADARLIIRKQPRRG